MWSFYFLAKSYLYFSGFIRIDVLLNLIFLAFVVTPAPKQLTNYRSFTIARLLLSMVLGILLLWHDSWFPPPIEAAAFLYQQGIPSFQYIIHFLSGYYKPTETIILFSVLSACYWVRSYKKFTTAVSAILITIPILMPMVWAGKSQEEEFGPRRHQNSVRKVDDIGKFLNTFYEKESERVVQFKSPKSGNSDFDIVILNVCSLSLDDMKEMGMEEDPFFKQFDYLFTNFNSVATYSNPAVIRILQANCGQRRHSDLYTDNTPKACSLLESLRTMGFDTYFTINHDAKYGGFAEEVKRYGKLDISPLIPSDLAVQKQMFDNSPVYSDFAVLEKWWKLRQSSKSGKAAVYYNTVSLHDGSHMADEKNWWKGDRKKQYEQLVPLLLRDISKFLELIKSSGRNAVVIFIPEHGRALTGSTIQASGLRDIPLPRITKIPVGIKFIGEKFNDATVRQTIISKPASHFAISYMLATFIENSPFGTDGISPEDLVYKIPQTDFVAENQGNIIVGKDNSYFFYGKEKKWIPLTADQLK